MGIFSNTIPKVFKASNRCLKFTNNEMRSITQQIQFITVAKRMNTKPVLTSKLLSR